MAVYEVVLNGEGPMGDMLTVLHYEVTSGPDPANWQQFSNGFYANLVPDVVAVLPPTVKYTGITVREDTPGSVGIEYPFAAGDAVGTAASGELIPQAAVLVRKLTNGIVRPAYGRIYQGGIDIAYAQANGTWGTTLLGILETFWEAMREFGTIDGSDLRMVIKASNPSAPNTAAYTVVSSVDARPNPVTQRRRRIGSGS
jgi:hypothetical protein